MIAILSPATTLDFETPFAVDKETTTPRFLAEANHLAARLQAYDAAGLAELMDLSESLATLNAERYAAWQNAHEPPPARPALLAYQGDAFQRIEAEKFSAAEWDFAQDHVRILSGLYGVLRPLDLILPHRLEMKTKWAGDGWDNLYEFWGDKITQALNDALAKTSGDTILDLASNEYLRAVQKRQLNGRLLTIKFQEKRGDAFRTIGVYAKRARGMMVRYLAQNQIDDPAALQQFDRAGYSYNPARSDANVWSFTRLPQT
jgi:hypothetical protein